MAGDLFRAKIFHWFEFGSDSHAEGVVATSRISADACRRGQSFTGTGFTAQSSKALPMDATIKRTEVTSSSSHLNKRSDQCDGVSVRQCLELKLLGAP
ncbi:unnamed protein product [Symbiodinium sp. CCMP2592]|nr:unnamed protein product [Symbiodinium sp. CCMP2592]